jgi:hypothetical protein
MRMRRLIIKKFFKKEILFVLFLIFLFLLGGTFITGNRFSSLNFLAKGQIGSLFFFPSFPTRLASQISLIKLISEELVKKNENLLNSFSQFDCKYAQSHCVEGTRSLMGGTQATCEPGPLKVFGSLAPPPSNESGDVEEITLEKQQANIKELNNKLSILKEILEGEISIGLDKQLKTLKAQDAQFIRENLEIIRDRLPQMISLIERNLSLPDNCTVNRCQPDCLLGSTFTAEACFGFSSEQKPIEVKFKVRGSIDDISLGRVGIENIHLQLPEKIQIPVPQLPTFNFHFPSEITINCPTQRQQIKLDLPPPPFPPQLPKITFSCVDYSSYSNSATCSSSSSNNQNFNEFEWWTKTFEYLSGECFKVIQKSAELTDQFQTEQGREEFQRLAAGCMNPNQVVQTLIDKCDQQWRRPFTGPAIWIIDPIDGGAFDICREIGHQRPPASNPDPTRREERAKVWCRRLFQNEGETPPGECSSNPIPVMDQKCKEIRDSGRQDPPLACKVFPLFSGRLDNSAKITIEEGGRTCPSQNIFDIPLPLPGCEIRAPSLPKISLPGVVIPDIRLPSINFPPLFRVKLPNVITEDLSPREIELCDLSDCHAQFPSLTFQPPTFKIPPLNIPPISLDIPGLPSIDFIVEPVNFQTLKFEIPKIKLDSLMMPELKIPEISLPKPKVDFSFEGLDFDIKDLFLGLLLRRINPPSFNQCVRIGGQLGILDIVYPDYYLTWPGIFKEVGPICKKIVEEIQKEQIRKGKNPMKDPVDGLKEWCRKQRDSLEKVTQQVERFQQLVNDKFQREIQDKLDLAAERVNEILKEEIEKHLDKIKRVISDELYKHLQKHAPQYVVPPSPEFGMVWEVVGQLSCKNVPPLKVNLPPSLQEVNINLGAELNEFLRREFNQTLPTEINVNLPPDWKKIKLDCNENSCKSCEDQGESECRNRFLTSTCPSFKAYENYLSCKINYRIKNCKNECRNCLSYELPPLPGCWLSYEKEITRRLPGHQVSVTLPRDILSGLKNTRECISKPARGNKPCQREVDEIGTNLNRIKQLNDEIQDASQKLSEMLL